MRKQRRARLVWVCCLSMPARLSKSKQPIAGLHDYMNVGGLMSYGTNPADTFRAAGVYAGRILKGAKPADLPVQQATKIDLAINLKVAKALGITVPTSIRLLATTVIE